MPIKAGIAANLPISTPKLLAAVVRPAQVRKLKFRLLAENDLKLEKGFQVEVDGLH